MYEAKQHNLDGTNILITGSSRGIGFYTALGLAEKGAHVIIVSHNEEHSREAARRINQSVHEGSAVDYVADLSSQEEIKRFADQIKSDYDHLDVLVNNVGGWFREYKESDDGIEMTFALNHLSYFLMTGLLMEMLIESSPSRIVNVSSEAHRQAEEIHFEDLQFKENYKPFRAYAQSKLANLLFTYELADRLQGKGITANALHPGFVSSHLYRGYGLLTPVIKFFAKIAGKSSEEGAQTSIYLASSPEVMNVSGKYFTDESPLDSSDASHDKDAMKRLWEVSEELTDFKYPFQED